MTITARYFFRQLTPEVIRLYGDYSVSRHRANNLFLPVAIEIKLLHGDISVLTPRAPEIKGLYI